MHITYEVTCFEIMHVHEIREMHFNIFLLDRLDVILLVVFIIFLKFIKSNIYSITGGVGP